MEDAKRILEMIEKGQITAAEGMELMNALDQAEPKKEATVATIEGNKNYKFLRVRVTTERGDTKVKVNVPLSLIKALGSVASLTQFVPDEAKDNIAKKGVNLNEIDFDAIFAAIEEGTLDDGTIVDIEAQDENDGTVWVKVYVD